MLEAGEFDLVALPLQKTDQREDRFEFSHPLYNVNFFAFKIFLVLLKICFLIF
jgi:hypothetical protein